MIGRKPQSQSNKKLLRSKKVKNTLNLRNNSRKNKKRSLVKPKPNHRSRWMAKRLIKADRLSKSYRHRPLKRRN